MKITKEQFERYEDIRSSGITNMGQINYVMELSGLTRVECLEIMKNYDKYMEEYLDVRKE